MSYARLARWVFVPLVCGVAALYAGSWMQLRHAGSFELAPSGGVESIAAHEAAVTLSLANVSWPYGDAATIKRTSRAALQALPESEGEMRARLFLRIGLIDDNPDGQRAVLASACQEAPRLCGNLQGAARREIALRRVAPGNHLPLPLIEGHP